MSYNKYKKAELIEILEKQDKYLNTLENKEKNSEKLIEKGEEIINNLEIQNKLLEKENELLERVIELNKLQSPYFSYKDIQENKIIKAKYFFKKGNGNFCTSKYAMIDKNEDNEYEQASYGVARIDTDNGISLDIVISNDSISFHYYDEEKDEMLPIDFFEIDIIIDRINLLKSLKNE